MKNSRKAALALTLISLGGCATDPFPAWHERNQAGQATVPPRMDDALALLQQDREAVRNKLRESVIAERQSGNLMLGSGILALIGAASGGHRDTILAPALLGGSVYTFNRYNDRTVASLIYKQALQAYDCIEAAVIPYRLGEAHRKKIEEAVGDDSKRTGLMTAIGDTTTARNALAALNRNADRPLLGQADTLIAQGRKTLNKLDTTRQDVHDIYAKISRLPATVAERLSGIRTVTDTALSDGQPKLDSIPALIADLPNVVASLKPASGYEQLLGTTADKATAALQITRDKSINGVESKKDNNRPLINALANLVSATHHADSNARELAAILAAVTKRQDYDRLKTCGIDEKALQAQMALTLDPAELDFTAKKKGQK
ncbi:MAG: hypothetical protein WC474_10310, partial [Hydrogenophilaceae bacterium]